MLSTRHAQRGQSMWGNLFMIVMLLFAAITGMKLWGPYYDDYAVQKALDNIKNESAARGMSQDALREAINKHLQISGVTLGKDDVKVVKSEKSTQITINYERRVPMYGNVDALVKFSHSLTLGPA